LSSRCVRSGERSPERSAIVHPFRLRRSHITAAAYLPACSHGPVRAKHGWSRSSSSARFRRPSAAPILAAAAAFGFAVLTKHMIDRRLRRAKPLPAAALRPRSKAEWLLPY